ncbi:rCG30018 [Rattus norvegicus]|uniref:Dendritic cell inhibitory receptor 3 n=2 Tax=Rattus norvegicus TaxID=10116 RepID=A6ILG4_RAT|nr:C-type lectin domain family 4, member A3 [Rattus norvegicus]AAR31147.1 dendritic cell inhibitory receptor 3 [Rattus norvegicus]AAS76658.1 dendritic cell inhibitory receptor 3 [Rattus norvegicus]EDM01975.1 rCG30018 [Rattus norvegicus]|eukprot:NP_001005891.1 C-type lectin domain family 4, member A3 [Rattus norvegicus]
MFSENIYINTNFKNKYDSSDIDTDFRPDPPKKSKSQKSCHKFSKVLFTSLIIYFLLLTILFSSALIILFKKYSQLLEEKTIMKELNYTELECTKWDSLLEDKVWSCCPKDWKPFDSNCYFPSTDSVESWMESEEKCSGIGAHLVVIHSQEEQDFLPRILDTHAAYFIGLSDPGHRQWQWVDQTPYNGNATFWHEGEPSSDNEQCVIINHHENTGWGWSDSSCSDKQKLVCQVKKIYL